MSNNRTTSGIGIGTIMFIVLLVLKITGKISMGWFWVITSFIWAPILGLLMIFSLFVLFGIILILLGYK